MGQLGGFRLRIGGDRCDLVLIGGTVARRQSSGWIAT